MPQLLFFILKALTNNSLEQNTATIWNDIERRSIIMIAF